MLCIEKKRNFQLYRNISKALIKMNELTSEMDTWLMRLSGGKWFWMKTYLIAMLFDLRWFQRWFISSNRRCSMTASSCEVNEPNSFRPVPSRRSYTTRCVSISDCRSCMRKKKKTKNKKLFYINMNDFDLIWIQLNWIIWLQKAFTRTHVCMCTENEIVNNRVYIKRIDCVNLERV